MYSSNSLYRLSDPAETFQETLLKQGDGSVESRVQLIVGDIRDTERLGKILATGAFDAVVHLAAIVGVRSCEEDVAMTQEINVDASIALAELAALHGVGRLLFASTYSVYGNQAGAVVDESASFNPTSAYEKSKIAVEEYLQETSPLPWTVFRFATACGLSFRTRFDLLSNQLTIDAVQNGRVEIFQGGDMRSFVHVRDIARAIGAVLEAPLTAVEQQVFNVGEAYRPEDAAYGSLSCSKQDLALLIKERLAALAIPVNVQTQDFAEDARNAILVADKLRNVLGIAPRFTLADSIDEIALLLHSYADFNPRDAEYYERAGTPFTERKASLSA